MVLERVTDLDPRPAVRAFMPAARAGAVLPYTPISETSTRLPKPRPIALGINLSVHLRQRSMRTVGSDLPILGEILDELVRRVSVHRPHIDHERHFLNWPDRALGTQHREVSALPKLSKPIVRYEARKHPHVKVRMPKAVLTRRPLEHAVVSKKLPERKLATSPLHTGLRDTARRAGSRQIVHKHAAWNPLELSTQLVSEQTKEPVPRLSKSADALNRSAAMGQGQGQQTLTPALALSLPPTGKTDSSSNGQ